MPKSSILALACLSLAVLTGCSATSGAAADPAATKQDKPHQIQALRADCMKQKGFKYVPYVDQFTITDQRKKAASGDPEAMREVRTKYGFDVFSWFVYPKDMGSPAVIPDNPPPVNPNWAIQGSLSEAQRGAYSLADQACETQAIKQVTGKVVKSMEDADVQRTAMVEQISSREIDGDPKLVELASAMADCLKAKGYRVSNTKPTALADRGRKVYEAQKYEIAKNDDIPDTRLAKGKYYEPTGLTPAMARPYLDREVKEALDDLECGKDFYPAFMPKSLDIDRRAAQEFGWATWS